jgi:hypothetical protein
MRGPPPVWTAALRSHGRALVMLGWASRGDCDAFLVAARVGLARAHVFARV